MFEKNYQLDCIMHTISKTQRYQEKIKENWPLVINYKIKNLTDGIKNEYEKDIEGDLDKISFNPLYLVNSYEKIFNQIQQFDKKILEQNNILPVFFYAYIPEKEEGQNVIINRFNLDWRIFGIYYNAQTN